MILSKNSNFLASKYKYFCLNIVFVVIANTSMDTFLCLESYCTLFVPLFFQIQSWNEVVKIRLLLLTLKELLHRCMVRGGESC